MGKGTRVLAPNCGLRRTFNSFKSTRSCFEFFRFWCLLSSRWICVDSEMMGDAFSLTDATLKRVAIEVCGRKWRAKFRLLNQLLAKQTIWIDGSVRVFENKNGSDVFQTIDQSGGTEQEFGRAWAVFSLRLSSRLPSRLRTSSDVSLGFQVDSHQLTCWTQERMVGESLESAEAENQETLRELAPSGAISWS